MLRAAVVTMLAMVKRTNRALLASAVTLCAATLLATSAYAQSPNASPQGKGHAADDAKKAGTPAAAKADDKKADDKKADDKKADKADDKKGDDKGKMGSDHASRVAKQHEDQKAQLHSMLKGPMDAPVKEELRRHAERLARLDRIKAVATEAKDTDAVDRATKLTVKENARHDKWMEKHVATVAAAPGAVAPGATAVPAAAPDTKGGAK
jgi:hypothetical protein